MSNKLQQELRQLLASTGVRPQKSWGQNFLVDEEVYAKILAAAELQPDNVVLEIGAGTGFLTRELAARVGKVIALELERGLASILEAQLAGKPNVTLLFEDGAEYQPGPGPYKIVANIPYQITGRLLRHYLTEVENKPQSLVLLVQKEVAQKALVTAPEATMFSMSIAPFATVEIMATVGRSSFSPAPRVDSAILRLKLFPESRLKSDQEQYFKLLHWGFGNRRKQLLNSLSGGLQLSKAEVAKVLQRLNIDPMRRPQTLSLEEWDALAGTVEFNSSHA